MVDVAIPSDNNIRKKEQEFEKYKGLKEELKRMWGVKTSMVPVVIGAVRTLTPKWDMWLKQIPGITSEVSVQKSAILVDRIPDNPDKILSRTLRLPGLW